MSTKRDKWGILDLAKAVRLPKEARNRIKRDVIAQEAALHVAHRELVKTRAAFNLGNSGTEINSRFQALSDLVTEAG